MNVTVDKLDLIQQILLFKDEKLLDEISKLIQTKRKPSEGVDGWDELPNSKKDYIETSQKQMENGEGVSLGEMLAKYKKKLNSYDKTYKKRQGKNQLFQILFAHIIFSFTNCYNSSKLK